jgi:hypothetical protein
MPADVMVGAAAGERAPHVEGLEGFIGCDPPLAAERLSRRLPRRSNEGRQRDREGEQGAAGQRGHQAAFRRLGSAGTGSPMRQLPGMILSIWITVVLDGSQSFSKRRDRVPRLSPASAASRPGVQSRAFVKALIRSSTADCVAGVSMAASIVDNFRRVNI